MRMKALALVLAVSASTLLPGAILNITAIAAPLPVSPLAAQTGDPLAIEVQRRVGGRGRVYVGPRFARPVNVWRPRHAYVIGPGYQVARPWWRPGTAVVAGAALGFIAAGAAVAWAGQPPGPGYCWFYTDPTYRAGFWDICPP